MTRDELLFLQQRLEAAGFGERAIVAAAEADQAWRLQQKAKRDARRAEAMLLADAVAESGIESENPDSVGNPDSRPVRLGLGSEAAEGQSSNKKAIARKALLMARTLRPAAQRVGAWLIERYNLTSGRCDPSVPRLVKDTGVSERSVRRAIKELEGRGLFVRAPVGGRLYRMGFRPVWAALEALGEESELRSVPSTLRGSGPTAGESENPDSAAKSGAADSGDRQNHVRIPTSVEVERIQGFGSGPRPASVPGSNRTGGQQLELRVMAPLKPTADAVEDAIRGKYRNDHLTLRAYLAAWCELDDAIKATLPDLASFEAWLRAQGPPQALTVG